LPLLEAIFQFISESTSTRAWARPSSTCTHSASITREPSGFFVSCAHLRTSATACTRGADDVSATRSWLSWLVISGQPPLSSPTRFPAGTRTSS
jgi:hypothetical protein